MDQIFTHIVLFIPKDRAKKQETVYSAESLIACYKFISDEHKANTRTEKGNYVIYQICDYVENKGAK